MGWKYSKSTNEFYNDIAAKIPQDAVPITEAVFIEMMTNVSNRGTVTADLNGNPVAVPPVGPTLEESQTTAQAQLLTNMNEFILHKPDGSIRYDQNFINSALMFALSSGAGALTVAPMPALLGWQNAVRSYYFQTIAGIKAATAVAQVQAIDVSVAKFEALFGENGTQSKDPAITTEQLTVPA
jgi:hypothetical protein